MVTLAEAAVQSDALQALSLVLNVGQAIALAWIASRSTRRRRGDDSE
jgi:hypothetical protein